MRNFRLKDMLADAEVKIFPGRDEVTTQPYPPKPGGIEVIQQPMIPTEIRHEITVAQEIFAELLQVDPAGRDRIMHMVSDLLRLYAPVEAESEEGAEE